MFGQLSEAVFKKMVKNDIIGCAINFYNFYMGLTMVVLQIKNTKAFMNTLLRGSDFDEFLLEEAVIKTGNSYTIDGHVNKEFYGDLIADEAPYDLSRWVDIKNVCFELIKGKHTPLGFKFVMQVKPEHTTALLQKKESALTSNDVAFVINVKFADGITTITSASAIKTFSLDKSYEQIWDDAFKRFLTAHEIEFEEL